MISQGFSQEEISTVKEIQKLIEQDSFTKARLQVAKTIALYKAEVNFTAFTVIYNLKVVSNLIMAIWNKP